MGWEADWQVSDNYGGKLPLTFVNQLRRQTGYHFASRYQLMSSRENNPRIGCKLVDFVEHCCVFRKLYGTKDIDLGLR